MRWTEQAQAGPPTHREERTDTPTAFVREFSVRAAVGADGEVPGMQVLRPSLEDIYLAMIGAAAAAEDTAQAATQPEGDR